MVCGTYRYDLALKRRTFMTAWRLSLAMWPARIVVFGLLPLGFTFAFWLAWSRGQYGPVIFLTLFVVLYMLIVFFYIFVVVPRQFQSEPYADTDFSVCFSEEGMTQKSVSGENRLAWNAIRFARELPEHFLLMFHNRLVLLIPKAAFSGEAEVQAVRELLQTHIPQK